VEEPAIAFLFYHHYIIIRTKIKQRVLNMPLIKPLPDLRNKSNEILKLANNTNEPDNFYTIEKEQF
jgi:hypothetical protein